METIYITFGAFILYITGSLIAGKPFGEEQSFSDHSKLHCIDSSDGLDYEKSNQNSLSNYYKPASRLDGLERSPNKEFQYDKKRFAPYENNENFANGILHKRQVGVVYKDDEPVGILQPYQRSYRFIPINGDNVNDFDNNDGMVDISYNLDSNTDLDKREINGLNFDSAQLDDSYPSILTNFKIVNKLDKKRNYDVLTDDNVRDLKSTIRRLRSSNIHNNEQIEEELKNILDDMGLIEDEENHGEKRETSEQQNEGDSESLEEEIQFTPQRNKRDEACIHNDNSDTNRIISDQFNVGEKRNDIKNDLFSTNGVNQRENVNGPFERYRRKRQKAETISPDISRENSKLIENLKDSGDVMISGNKSPLASSSEIAVRNADATDLDKMYETDNDDYETRVERQIQNKINSLKEQVKREIDVLKEKNSDKKEDDIQRQKRQVADTLIDEETDELNPALNPEGKLAPLIRRRRSINHNNLEKSIRKKRQINFPFTRNKRAGDPSAEVRNKDQNYKTFRESTDEDGDLLGGDDFGDGLIYKRHVLYDDLKDHPNSENSNLNELRERNKRSENTPNDFNSYDNGFQSKQFYENHRKLKRDYLYDEEDITPNQMNPSTSDLWNPRIRRRINDNQVMANRPQQLSDLSDFDIFGALPKSYDGELSRYKRVKRN